MVQLTRMESPVGPLALAAADGRVCLVHLGWDRQHVHTTLARWYPDLEIQLHPDPAGIVSSLTRYFEGDVRAIDDVPVVLNGTPFQQRVWQALRTIPAGRTWSYSELAERIGATAAVRAVGAANGANPVAIVVPCHRVIGRDGSLTGYGGGLERKRWLLHHEGAAPLSLLGAL